MDRTVIAKELLSIARDLVAVGLETDYERQKYKQDHKVRPDTKIEMKPHGQTSEQFEKKEHKSSITL